MPAWANDHWTRPEQSKTLGPLPPQTYGRPLRLSAEVSIVLIREFGTPLNVVGPEPAPPPRAELPPVVTTLTSWLMPAPLGSSFASVDATPVMFRPRTLTTIALS